MKRRHLWIFAAMVLFALSCSDSQHLTGPGPGSSTEDNTTLKEPHMDPQGVQNEFSGIARVGIVLVHFTGTPTSHRWDDNPQFVTQIEQMIFDDTPGAASVHNLYQEMSYGVDGFSHAGTYGPYTIGVDYTVPCPTGTGPFYDWNDEAYDSLALDSAFDPGDVDILVYVYPGGNHCDNKNSINGIAIYDNQSLSGKPEIGIYNWDNTPSNYAHEIGHLKGWLHAGVPGGTVADSYNDLADVMGNNYDDDALAWIPLRQVGLVRKLWAGYIPPSSVVSYTTPGTYTVYLHPTEADPAGGGTQGIMIQTQGNTQYFVSYRSADPSLSDFDSDTFFDDLMGRIHIHEGLYTIPYPTTRLAVLEASSGLDTYEGDNFSVVALSDGLTGADSVEVQVTIDAAWDHSASLTPSTQYQNAPAAGPDNAKPYTLRVTDNDPVGGPPATFTLVPTYDTGMTSDLPESVTVDAGTYQQITVTLSFDQAPAEGSHSFSIDVVDPTGARTTQTVNADYVVDTVAPPAPTNLSAVGDYDGVHLSWTPQEPYGYCQVHRLDLGSYFYALNYNNLLDNTVQPGTTYWYRVRQVDGAGNESAWSDSISVTTPDECPNPLTATISDNVVTNVTPGLGDNVATFTVTFTNDNEPGCPDVAYTVSGSSGAVYYDFYPASQQVTLASGETASFDLGAYYNGGCTNVFPCDPVPPVDGVFSFNVSVYGGGNSESFQPTFTLDRQDPDVPAGVSIMVAACKTGVYWTAPSDNGPAGIAAYEVREGTTSLGTTETIWMLIDGIDPAASYQVRSIDAAGNTSDWSSAVSIDYSAPTVSLTPMIVATSAPALGEWPQTCTLSVTNHGTAGRTFDVATVGALDFDVSADDAQFVLGENGSGSTTVRLDINSIPAEGQYPIQVVVSDACGILEADTLLSTFAVDYTAPDTPTGLHVTAVGSNFVTVAWTASGDDNSGFDYYEILRDGDVVGTSTNPVFTDTGLVLNTTYQYRVRAYDLAGNVSADSDPVNGTTQQSGGGCGHCQIKVP